jgi:hypothetical protein
MNGLKRYIRPGLVVSVIAHLAALMVGSFLVGASASNRIGRADVVTDLGVPDRLIDRQMIEPNKLS